MTNRDEAAHLISAPRAHDQNPCDRQSLFASELILVFAQDIDAGRLGFDNFTGHLDPRDATEEGVAAFF